jgi:general stress protein YciG
MKNQSDVHAAVRKFLSEIGRKGGSSCSERKRIAAAKNGAKGGRPKRKDVVVE